MYTYRSRYSKMTKCSNCASDIGTDDGFCNVCGMEFLDTGIICVEDLYKKNYSCLFDQKPRKHNPYVYCKSWLLKLQGKESVNISSENFTKILELANSWINQNNNQELSCTIIRNWLKRLSLTKYYTHVTWLRKEIESACNINGHSYDLSSEEMEQILNHFREVITEFSNIREASEILQKKRVHNIPSYPYFIVKILSLIIRDKDRLKILLSNVHFQCEKTHAKNENIWKLLCKKLNY
jgi:hypothetical protein